MDLKRPPLLRGGRRPSDHERWDGGEERRTDPRSAAIVAIIVLVVGVLAVVAVIALTRNEGKSSTPLDSAVPPTAAPATTGINAAGPVSLTAGSYSNVFTISTCARAGKGGIVLQGTDANGASVVLSAPNGSGSLAITGAGSAPDRFFLSGRVTSGTIDAAGQFTLQGNLDASATGPTGPFTVTGICA